MTKCEAGEHCAIRNCNLYSSPNIKQMKFRWADHVAYIGAKRKECLVLARGPKRKRRLGRPRIYGRTIYIKEIGWGMWTGVIRLKTGAIGGLLWASNKLSCFVKLWEFPKWLSNMLAHQEGLSSMELVWRWRVSLIDPSYSYQIAVFYIP
jgi:hypothetical protein